MKEILHKILLVINLSPLNIECSAMLICSLKLRNKTHRWEVLDGFQINFSGVSVFFI